MILSPTSNILIQKRQFQNAKTCNCKWSNKEVELLLKLNKDMNGDINKISNYFDKRTPLAIQRKLQKIKIKINV